MEKFPLLPRKKSADKSRYGHALVVAGSRGLTGAAVLAATAALRSGAGLVTLAFPESLEKWMTKTPPEIMKLGLPETAQKSVGPKAFPLLKKFIGKRKINSIVLGPGLSLQTQTQGFVRRFVKSIGTPIVLDADGLNAFSAKGGSASGGKGYLQILRRHRAPLILTPHRREFERLFGAAWPEVQRERIALAKKLSRFYDVVLVLKGRRTLVIGGNKFYINTTGNPGLAKGGSGDVLSGMIGAFVAQGLDLFQASRWAAYFHGRAADSAVKQKGELGLTASDVIEYLPKAFSLE